MSVTKDITTENDFSDPLMVCAGYFSISVQGTFVGKVTLQKTYDETNWRDVEVFTSSGEHYGLEPEGSKYRIGIKTGDYNSGSVKVRLGV